MTAQTSSVVALDVLNFHAIIKSVLPCLPNGSRVIMIHRLRESSFEIRGF